jgi:hypothetical protein
VASCRDAVRYPQRAALIRGAGVAADQDRYRDTGGTPTHGRGAAPARPGDPAVLGPGVGPGAPGSGVPGSGDPGLGPGAVGPDTVARPAGLGPGGGRERWRGISVLRGRLWYRAPTERGRRAGVRFEPDGLVVVAPGGMEQTLPWDDGERPDDRHAAPAGGRLAWHLLGVPRGRGNWVSFRLTITHTGGSSRQVRLPSGLQPPSYELPALCRYLSSTPAARPGLADAGRTQALVDALAAGLWRRPEPPQEPLAGDRLQLHQAVGRALAAVGWRLVDGRPIAGEPRPGATGTVREVRRALPDEMAERVPHERVLAELERHLAVGPWPFDVLVDG